MGLKKRVKGTFEKLVPISPEFYDTERDEDLVAPKNVLLPFNAFLLFSQWIAFIALMVYYSGPANYVSTSTIETDYRFQYPKYNCTPLVTSEYWGSRIGFDFCAEQTRKRPPSAATISNFDNTTGPWEYKPFAHTERPANVPTVSRVLAGDNQRAQTKYKEFLKKVAEKLECQPIAELEFLQRNNINGAYPGQEVLGWQNKDREDWSWTIQRVSGVKRGADKTVPEVQPTFAYIRCRCDAELNFPDNVDTSVSKNPNYQVFEFDDEGGPFTQVTCSANHCRTIVEAKVVSPRYKMSLYEPVANNGNGTCVCKGKEKTSSGHFNNSAPLLQANITNTDQGGCGPVQCEPKLQSAYPSVSNTIHLGQGSGGSDGTDDWRFVPYMVVPNYTFTGTVDQNDYAPSCINYIDDADWRRFSNYSGEGDNTIVPLFDLIAEDSCYYKWDAGYYELVMAARDSNYELYRALGLSYKRGKLVEKCMVTPEKALSLFQLALDEDNMYCTEFIDSPVFNCETSGPPSIPQRFSLAYANSLLLYTVFSTICVKLFFAAKKEPAGETAAEMKDVPKV